VRQARGRKLYCMQPLKGEMEGFAIEHGHCVLGWVPGLSRAGYSSEMGHCCPGAMMAWGGLPRFDFVEPLLSQHH